jgi:antitoxin (DNA-binding transcriptional repressor) of toxin-antitoxin stability system
MDMRSSELTISASEFKAKCLDILKRLGDRRLTRVVVTRRGKPVAELTPPLKSMPTLATPVGAMKGSVIIPPGLDIVGPIFKGEMLAERGILYLGE